MQNLEVISINFWQMLASLANLLILFLILKKLLYTPVMKVLLERRTYVEKQYTDAETALSAAKQAQSEYAAKLSEAEATANEIRTAATAEAKRHSEQIMEEAQKKADGILRQAESEIALSQKKAASEMKREIASVSTKLAEKLMERELDEETHRELIDSMIDKIGEKA